MDRANTAMLDSKDEAARRRSIDEELITGRFCRSSVAYFRRQQALVTWAPDGLSFTCEHGDESVARWAGFQAMDDEREDDGVEIEPIWMGTVRTARGTYAAQFVVESES